MIAQLSANYIKTKPSRLFPRLYSYFFLEGRPATTRGKWFNPVTFFSLRRAAKSKTIAEAESPLFITGTGRSGSTILGMVLSMHPDVLFLNEPKALWYLANPKDDIIGSYSKTAGHYFLREKDATTEIVQTVKGIYSKALRTSHTSCIVDKYPEMVFRTDYISAIFQSPRFIFLTRNAADTIASTTKWSDSHKNEPGTEGWWGVENRKWKLLTEEVVPLDEYLGPHAKEIAGLTSETDKAAVEWIVTMNHGLKELLKYPDRFLRVRYEDICENSDRELHRICDFAKLNADPVFLKYGSETIQPASMHAAPKVHPILMEPMQKVAEKLGYAQRVEVMSVTE